MTASCEPGLDLAGISRCPERLKRVLVVSSCFPYPPTNGLALRIWAVVRSLAANGHQVHLLAFGNPDQLRRDREAVLDVCHGAEVVPHDRGSLSGRLDVGRRLRTLLSRSPYAAACSRSAEIRARIAEFVSRRRVDAIVCEETQHLVNFPEFLPVPLIVDHHNAEFVLLGRYLAQERNPVRALYAGWELRKVRRWERSASARADAVLVCSETDRSIFQNLSPRASIVVAPNVIDIQNYAAAPPAADGAILYAGGMDWYPNRDAVAFFAFQILPCLRKSVARPLRFVVAGRGPDPAFRRELASVPELEFTGFLPDLRTEIARAAVCVVPLRIGSGTRLKILEAAAMGKAVVSTRIGAEGLEFVDGREILLADAPGDFAAAIASLLADSSRCERIGRAARKRVEQQYNLSVLRRSIAQAMELIERKTAGSAVPAATGTQR